MLTGRPADITTGGACAFQLPRDPSAASQARTLIVATMREIGFTTDTIDDAKLAVSELATNAHTHASSRTRPELWIWARTRPAPELVVSVFDTHRDTWPVAGNADLLDEHGKGLSIVAALAARTGSHFTRSRLTAMTGKCVWFTLRLPASWPMVGPIAPKLASDNLLDALRRRGVSATGCSDEAGVSVLTVAALNIWVGPTGFSWRDGRAYVRQPLIDLQETAERIVSRHETTQLHHLP
ncbi:ATP-binding protein [Actinomadura nitritigenes]|uniref:ATP-binding protein n=1 Tax=Actinomadura nitritigenes TaxID=134602 RepID=UPI00369809FF